MPQTTETPKSELSLEATLLLSKIGRAKLSQTNGKDLIQMGFGGKDIGIGLELALNGVIDEKVENKKEELKGYIESNFKRQDKDNT